MDPFFMFLLNWGSLILLLMLIISFVLFIIFKKKNINIDFKIIYLCKKVFLNKQSYVILLVALLLFIITITISKYVFKVFDYFKLDFIRGFFVLIITNTLIELILYYWIIFIFVKLLNITSKVEFQEINGKPVIKITNKNKAYSLLTITEYLKTIYESINIMLVFLAVGLNISLINNPQLLNAYHLSYGLGTIIPLACIKLHELRLKKIEKIKCTN
ncbi:hypothetical protein PYL11_01420 [Staphylococcus epidermidis]|nr:hypothetical protein [Staphylococcus epidermidis]